MHCLLGFCLLFSLFSFPIYIPTQSITLSPTGPIAVRAHCGGPLPFGRPPPGPAAAVIISQYNKLYILYMPVAYRLLPTAFCLLPIACRLLPVAYCLTVSPWPKPHSSHLSGLSALYFLSHEWRWRRHTSYRRASIGRRMAMGGSIRGSMHPYAALCIRCHASI